MRYSVEGDTVLDPFVGGGTTAVEAKLTNRNFIGVDINTNALEITNNKLNFECEFNPSMEILQGDARNLSMLADESVDLICAHPPYADIIHYSEDINGDLSLMPMKDFLFEIGKVAEECYRVLKKGKFCAILMGDTRKNGMVQPLAFETMRIFEMAGFKTKEIIIQEVRTLLARSANAAVLHTEVQKRQFLWQNDSFANILLQGEMFTSYSL